MLGMGFEAYLPEMKGTRNAASYHYQRLSVTCHQTTSVAAAMRSQILHAQ